mgnify:CR=1 FL=1
MFAVRRFHQVGHCGWGLPRDARSVESFNQRHGFITRRNVITAPLKSALKIYKLDIVGLTSGGLMEARLGLAHFWRARICSKALNGARQIGQLLAWYLKESAQELHRHKWRQGRIKVSRTSHMQITHSEPLSSVSSSPDCYNKSRNESQTNNETTLSLFLFSIP